MSDVIIIANFISIICIALFTAWVSTWVKDPFKAFYNKLKGKPLEWESIIDQKKLNLAYPLIAVMIFIALLLTTQLGIGNVKVRPDLAFYLNTGFWLVMPAFVVTMGEEFRRLKNKK